MINKRVIIRLTEIILRLFFHEEDRKIMSADLEEGFGQIQSANGQRQAYFWLTAQAAKIIYGKIYNIMIWSFPMLKNYMKIAARGLMKDKGYSFINIAGLAVGFAVFILSTLFPNLAFDTDKHHKNADRIYGVIRVQDNTNKNSTHSALLPGPLKKALEDEFPEIEEAVSFFNAGRKIVTLENENFYQNGVVYADKNFFSFFTFNMIFGDPKTALAEPYSVVLKKETAEKYFGDENPIGKILRLDNKVDVIVTGVTEKVKLFSSIQYDFLMSTETARALYSSLDDWNASYHSTFVLLPKGYDPIVIGKQLPAFIDKHYSDSPDSPDSMYLMPFLDFFFESRNIQSFLSTEPALPYYILVFLGTALLLIACINFMNLSTARAVTRAAEVGIRKVVGAQRSQLIKQFIGESVIITLLGLILGVLFFEMIRPAFLALYDNSFYFSLWDNPVFILFLVGITILTGILAGIYPAFVLSSFNPVQVLKGHFQTGKKSGQLRKALVVFQFTLSAVIIVLIIVLQNQLGYMLNLDFNYNRENVIVVPIEREVRDKLPLMQESIEKMSGVTSVSAAIGRPGAWNPEKKVIPEGYNPDEAWLMSVYGIDYNFIELFEMKMSKGRIFSKEYSDDNKYIINELAARQLEWNNPIGKELTIGDQKGVIIGVVNDFHIKDINSQNSPSVLYIEQDALNYMFIKTASAPSEEILENVKEQWLQIVPDLPFEHSLLIDFFNLINSGTIKGVKLGMVFAFIAILISNIGLLALASYTIQRKRKEIGIRKVLGASVSGLTQRLTSEFILLIVISNLFGAPFGYWVSKLFIDNMYSAYPVEIGIGVYFFAAAITVVTGMFAVIYQTWRAAYANPVNSLKYE